MSKVSIIIPTFNQSRYLGESVTSALAQSFRSNEVIVVDDGSTDDTPQVMARFPQVHYVRQENHGESAARNAGIRLSAGEYIAFLDADDAFLPDKLERQVSILDAQPAVGVVYSDVYLCDADGNPQRLFSSQLGCRRVSGRVFESLVRGNFLTVDSVLVRREVFERVGLFDESLRTFPDWDLWLRVSADYTFEYVDAPVARYRMHPEMVSRDRLKMWQGALAVRRKLVTMPAFQSCSSATQQYCYYQLGLLDCLAGNTRQGRQHLWRAFRGSPALPVAGAAWTLAFFGQKFLRAIVAWRAARRGWLAESI